MNSFTPGYCAVSGTKRRTVLPTTALRNRQREKRRRTSDDDLYEEDAYWDSRADLNDGMDGGNGQDNDYDPDDDYYDYDDDVNSPLEPGPYNVYFEDDDLDPTAALPSWEQCPDGSTWVLLPPSYISKPTAVLHFVGGTFFGSSPKLWYRKLLEGIVTTTPCTIVATSIPVTLFKNPLQHVTLSRRLQRSFENAYLDVLQDEYGDLSDVPVVGMGHSLGARLLMVAATLGQSGNSDIVPNYQSYILMSFTNYGASVSVPGVEQLLSQRNSLDDEEERWGRSGGRRRRRQKEQEQRRRQQEAYERRGRQRRSRRSPYDDDDDEFDWGEDDWQELEETVRTQATKVRNALTPKSEELEFFPSPDQLWKAISVYKRYEIPKTLLVQFEDDVVDQGSRLANSLKNVSDVKFARLKGYHLTPVSTDSENERIGSANGDREDSWLQLPGKASRMLWKVVQGRSSRKKSATTMRDLRQSIVRYIMDEATK